MKNFLTGLNSTLDYAEDQSHKDKVNFLKEVRSWILTGQFSNYSRAQELLTYHGMEQGLVARAMGMKESSVRVARSDLSKELYGLFGTDFFAQVDNWNSGGKEDLQKRFDLAKSPVLLSQLVPTDILMRIPQNKSEKFGDLQVQDCIQEAQFLSNFSVPVLESRMADLDERKLRFLLGILKGEAGSRRDTVGFTEAILRKGKNNG